ncbi:MAG: PIN domain-containing protein [Patescibacteria group bacterium]|jgi:predicted nucleic-acid-binding protein
MAKYIVDTNVFLRFLLKDNEEYFKKARRYFLRAKKHQITLILLPVVVLEINYVLKGVYSLSRQESAKILSSLLKSPLLMVKERKTLIKAVDSYEKINIDLADVYLSAAAQEENAKVLSFDKDFEKIK